MGKTLTIDGRSWTDRGDGIYLPDNGHHRDRSPWCVGEDYGGKDFIVLENDDGSAELIAMVLEEQMYIALYNYMESLSSSSNMFTMSGDYGRSCIGGIV